MPPADARIILYHKQATSARTLFLSIDGSVCLFGGLPKLSHGSSQPPPAQCVTEAERALGLSAGGLEVDSEFHATADTPGQEVPVFLARFTAIDPPRALAAEHGGRFIALTEARGYPAAELELLRQAYAVIMEG